MKGEKENTEGSREKTKVLINEYFELSGNIFYNKV